MVVVRPAARKAGPKRAEGERAMNKPVLVIMAAGMGSRYGGLKQLDPVGEHGQDRKSVV